MERIPGKRGLKVYHDLFSFYRSKEWRKLLAALKIERLDENDQLICEYCGKPITHAYDAIGHHIQELTEENVNDAMISLNPKNIAFLHAKCHNLQHDKLGYSRRQVYIVYGPPLSGKTTWVMENKLEGDLVVDVDSIWQCVSGLDQYRKPNRLKSVVFRMRDDLIDVIKYRFGKWSNAYVIGGYPLQLERERLAMELGAREVFMNASREECLARLEASNDRDKEEWKRYVDEWFDRWTPPVEL